MTQEEYIKEVCKVLDLHREHVVSELKAALALVPVNTREVSIDIFVDQDGEGQLDIRVGLDGPDLYVLNRAIKAHAKLFETRMTKNGLEPPGWPLQDPLTTEFSVPDALTDCAAMWVESVWKEANCSGFALPVVVVSSEGYGTKVPMQLHS